MFSTLIRANSRKYIQRQSTNTSTTTTTAIKRRFGADAHHDHHHVEKMSTHSELPANDWRNKPMHWDFSQQPRSSYEAFVSSNLSGPEDPALKLTKGQFIVYMRALGREQRGEHLLFQRTIAVTVLLATVTATNKYWPENDVVANTFADLQYQSIFHTPLLQTGVGKKRAEWTNSQQFRHRLDEFFSQAHDEATLAKLPADLQTVYHKYKDEYNEQYASQPPLFTLNTNLTQKTIFETRAALKAQYNLTDAELYKIVGSCDVFPLLQQVYGVDDVEGLEQRISKPAFEVATAFNSIPSAFTEIVTNLKEKRKALKKQQRD